MEARFYTGEKFVNKVFQEDYYARYGEEWEKGKGAKRILKDRDLRYVFIGRMSIESKSFIVRSFFRLIRHKMAVKRCTEINFKNIKRGFSLSHGNNIIVNCNAKIGKYVNLRNGVTIGMEARGKRKGVPKIGDCVWVGSNATIVGKIRVGNNVLIAPNAYVNRNIPDDSIVIGNPAVVIEKKEATKEYIPYIR